MELFSQFTLMVSHSQFINTMQLKWINFNDGYSRLFQLLYSKSAITNELEIFTDFRFL